MKFEIKDTAVIVDQNKQVSSEFFKSFDLNYPKFHSNNIILIIDKTQNSEPDFVNFILKLTKSHQLHKKTFVVVAPQWSQSDISDDIVCVPTLQEAFDLIEMDEMQRDLGF
ncbi:MAG: hypothetical protein ACON30_02635 [Flavobacteriaceae bacterium]